VLINPHHLPDQVVAFLQERPAGPMGVHTIHDPKLLGTAGTLLANQAFFNSATGPLIHADNPMTDDLSSIHLTSSPQVYRQPSLVPTTL
jgi:mannose-1-phosphate guanylyltransferase